MTSAKGDIGVRVSSKDDEDGVTYAIDYGDGSPVVYVSLGDGEVVDLLHSYPGTETNDGYRLSATNVDTGESSSLIVIRPGIVGGSGEDTI